jgi:IS30 family transposase
MKFLRRNASLLKIPSGPEFDTFAKKLFVRLLSSILFILCFVVDATGQIDSLKQKNDTLQGRSYLIQKVDRNGQVLPEVEIKAVTIYAHPTFTKKSDFRKYERLVYNLKKVYPYAVVVRKRLSTVDAEMANMVTDKERREYLKKVEKDVFAKYEGDIREMTITQGRLLIKLIDRETRNTSYVLIKDYRGKFAAAFWQGIARIFGTNLKEEYDPYGEDVIIESIITEIEAGRL